MKLSLKRILMIGAISLASMSLFVSQVDAQTNKLDKIRSVIRCNGDLLVTSSDQGVPEEYVGGWHIPGGAYDDKGFSVGTPYHSQDGSKLLMKLNDGTSVTITATNDMLVLNAAFGEEGNLDIAPEDGFLCVNGTGTYGSGRTCYIRCGFRLSDNPPANSYRGLKCTEGIYLFM